MESNAPKVSDDQLPVELLFDILLRLPVKSLLRLMCVSKSWKSLISSPEFIKTHLKTLSNARDPARRKLIFSIPRPPIYDCLTECSLFSVLYSLTTEATNVRTAPIFASWPTNIQHPAQKSIEIVGSCNGLVCIAIRKLIRHWIPINSINYMCLFLWNPSIRKYRRLPTWGSGFEEYSGVAAYGFGYDGLHDDYKVFALLSNNLDYDLERKVVGIYSQRTASWKRNEDFKKHLFLNKCSLQDGHFVQDTRCGHFVNGKLYWPAFCRRYGRNHKIVSFDLVDETYGDIELPGIIGRWKIGVLREGCLASFWSHYDRPFEVDIWFLNESGVEQSWTKMFSIHYPEDLGLGLQFKIRCLPVFLFKRNGLLLKVGPRLVLWNLETESYQDLNINYNLPAHARGNIRVDMIDESLVLLDGHDG